MTRMTVTEKTARSVTEFMDDPINFFGQSYTQMHSIRRAELEELQRQAMGIRFQQHHQSIEMLRKLADRLGITELNEFNDVVPLLFSHTAFKSYPSGADRQEAVRPDDQVAGQADQLRPVRTSIPRGAPASTTGSTVSTSRPRWR